MAAALHRNLRDRTERLCLYETQTGNPWARCVVCISQRESNTYNTCCQLLLSEYEKHCIVSGKPFDESQSVPRVTKRSIFNQIIRQRRDVGSVTCIPRPSQLLIFEVRDIDSARGISGMVSTCYCCGAS